MAVRLLKKHPLLQLALGGYTAVYASSASLIKWKKNAISVQFCYGATISSFHARTTEKVRQCTSMLHATNIPHEDVQQSKHTAMLIWRMDLYNISKKSSDFF